MPKTEAKGRGLGACAVAGVALVMLAVELVLVERKYGLFGGGFGQSRTLDQAGELAVFASAVIAAQFLLVALLFRAIRLLHGNRRDRPIFYFNFLFLAPALIAGALAAKFKLLSYFSDSISFALIRQLGGGSLYDAFLYVLSESGLVVLALGLAAGVYWLCYRAFRMFSFPEELVSSKVRLLPLLIVAPLLLLGAGRVGDARYGLDRFVAPALLGTTLGALTDFDRDGYSLFSTPADSHPFDGARHPLALDIPGNGIDEDGFAGDFAFAGEPAPPPPPEAAPRHVVLVVLESTRADAVGKRVAGRAVTPNLSALAARGSRFPEAYSHVGFTTESLKSLFSGRLAPSGESGSLFRDFKQRGYGIAVLSGQSESFGGIAEAVGMKRHSDIFIDADRLKEERAFSFAAQGSLLVDGRILLREFDRRLGRREAWRRPNFLYLNFQEAHFPYHHPGMPEVLPGRPIARSDISLANREAVERTYWNAVAYDDRLLGALIRRLKALDVYDDTLLIVTADHGESLFDDGFLGHGHMINRQQTAIPLILSQPGLAVARPIGLKDMRGLTLSALAGQRIDDDPGAFVFQHIGPLDRPASIGLVTKGGVWTVLDPASRMVRFSDLGREMPYDSIADPALRSRAERLAREWARQRWLHHRGRNG